MAAAGVLVSMFLTFNATMGVVFTMKALIVVIMGGVGNMLGALVAGPDARPRRDRGRAAGRSRPDLAATYALFLPCCWSGRPGCSGGRRDEPRPRARSPVAIAAWRALACVPLFGSGYHLALGISLLIYAVLATAWALFSGPTRYISLATVAFFGIGAYTVAVLGESCRGRWCCWSRAAIGVAVALVVGLSTLRLSGVYFVIFTFGLSELIRQLVTWYEVNVHTHASAATSSSTSRRRRSTGSFSRSRCWCSWPAG